MVRIGSLATIFVLAHFLYRMCSQIGTTMGPQLGFLEGQRRKVKKQKVPQIVDFTALSEFCELIYITCKLFSAEREGFEPPVPLGTTVFKTVVIDHSTISPMVVSTNFLSRSECKGRHFFP